jgi:hypothetical protein
VKKLIVSAWLASVGLLGCTSDTDLRSEITVGRAHLAVPATSLGPVTPSIASLDERVLLLWNDVVNDPVLASDPLSMRFRRYAQWFDETGPLSMSQDLGPSMGYFESWAHDGDALVAQSWGDPEDRVPQVAEDRRAFLLRADAGADLRWTQLTIPLVPLACPACARLFMPGLDAPAGYGLISTIDTTAGSYWALHFPPRNDECGPSSRDRRVHLASGGETYPLVWSWLEPLCSEDRQPAGESEGDVLDLHVAEVADSRIGALFVSTRSDGRGGGDRAYYFMHANLVDGSGFRVSREPIVVAEHRTSMEDGHQPRMTRVSGGVLAATLSEDTSTRCQTLRMFDSDGANSREAPWQLPCRRNDSLHVHYVEMASLPDGSALVVYSLRPTASGSSADEEDAVIEAVVVTAEGRRGSDIVRVTPEEARGLPIRGFAPLATGRPVLFVEGTRAWVAWVDVRADAPGLYWTSLDVRALPTPP